MAKDTFYGIKVTRDGGAVSEKVSVNMNTATLSSIDLLVDSGYYSNRSDFINQAVREALTRQQSTIDRIAGQSMAASAAGGSRWFLGVYWLTQAELEAMSDGGAVIKGYGMLRIEPDCDEDMLFAKVAEIKVKGRVSASESIKARYGLK